MSLQFTKKLVDLMYKIHILPAMGQESDSVVHGSSGNKSSTLVSSEKIQMPKADRYKTAFVSGANHGENHSCQKSIDSRPVEVKAYQKNSAGESVSQNDKKKMLEKISSSMFCTGPSNLTLNPEDMTTGLEVASEMASSFASYVALSEEEKAAVNKCTDMLSEAATCQKSICDANEKTEAAKKEAVEKIAKDFEKKGIICIPCGLGGGNSANSFFVLEKIDDTVYAYEFLDGEIKTDDLDRSIKTDDLGRSKQTIYRTRRIPGRTYLFENICNKNESNKNEKKERSIELAEIVELIVAGDNREIERRADLLKNPARPRFIASLQNGAPSAMRLIDLVARDTIQRTMANEKKVDVNDIGVQKASSKLYHMYGMYLRARQLYANLAYLRDDKNQITRESLKFLEKTAAAMGSYVNRNKKKCGENDNATKLLNMATMVINECNSFIKDEANVKIMHGAMPNQEMANNVSNNVTVSATEFVKAYVKEHNSTSSCARVTKHSILPQIAPMNFHGITSAIEGLVDEIRDAGSNKNTESGEATHELMYKAMKLLRNIPISFPSLEANPGFWGCNRRQKCDEEKIMLQRLQLMQNFELILGFVVNSAQSDFLFNGLTNGQDSSKMPKLLGMNADQAFPELAPIVNAIAKVRIVAFELAKHNKALAKALNNLAPDFSWITAFFNSAANFVTNRDDFEEQKRIFQYINGHCKEQKVFCYADDSDVSWESPETRFNTILLDRFLSDKENEDLLYWKTENVRNQVLDLVRRHLGRYHTSAEEDFLKNTADNWGRQIMGNNITINDRSRKSNKTIPSECGDPLIRCPGVNSSEEAASILAFMRIMAYGRCVVLKYTPSALKTGGWLGAGRFFRDKLVTRPENLFEELNSGYNMSVENKSRIENVAISIENKESERGDNIIGQIGEKLSATNMQTFSLLQFLMDNLDLCNGFCPPCEGTGKGGTKENANVGEARITDKNSDYFLFNLWIQAFLRVIFPDSNRDKNEYVEKIDEPTSPMINAACRNPLALLEFEKRLWAAGKKKFLSENPGQPPRVRQLCGLFHILHLINQSIISTNKTNSNDTLKKLATLVNEFREDLKSLGRVKKMTFNERMCLCITENECIADLVTNPIKMESSKNETSRKWNLYDEDQFSNELDDDEKELIARENHEASLRNEMIFGGSSDTEDLNLFASMLAESDDMNPKEASKSETCLDISDDDLAEFFINYFRLRSFEDKDKTSAKACAEFVHLFPPSMIEYLSEHPAQAKKVAHIVCEVIKIPRQLPNQNLPQSETNRGNSSGYGGDSSGIQKSLSLGQYADEDGNVVDLLSGSIRKFGNDLKYKMHIFHSNRFEHLFGAGKTFETIVSNNDYNFVDARYGNIIANSEGNDIRRVSDDGRIWHDVPPENINKISLPLYFGSNNFTVWCTSDGDIRIYSSKNPNEVLYETDKFGHLCDVDRKRRGIKNCFISFLKTNGASKDGGNDMISRFDDRQFMLNYYDDTNMATEIVFPRYVGPDNAKLSFVREMGKEGKEIWVLSSNRNYKVVNAPLIRIGDDGFMEYNPLAMDNRVIWLENTDLKSVGVFRCLLPMPSLQKSSLQNTDNAVCSYEQATLRADNLNFSTPYLRADTPSAALTLANISLYHGEYGAAMEMLEDFPKGKLLSSGELHLLRNIIYFAANPSESDLAAVVGIKALSILLSATRLNTQVVSIFRKIGNMESMVKRYMHGLAYCPSRMRIDYKEERNFWENFRTLCNSYVDPSTKIAPFQKITDGINKMISERTIDLTILIDEGDQAVKKVVTDMRKRKKSQDQNQDWQQDEKYRRLYDLFFANPSYMQMGDIDLNMNDVDISRVQESVEKNFYNEAQLLLPNDFPKVKQNASSSDTLVPQLSSNDIPSVSLSLTAEEKRRFGAVSDDFVKKFSEELSDGLRLQHEMSRSRSTTVPGKAELNKLIVKAEECRDNAEKIARSVHDKIIEFANIGRMEDTYDAGYWEKLTLPTILHAYGILVANGGKNGNGKALKFLQDSHPWFLSGIEPTTRNDLFREFFANVETYLLAANSVKHMGGIVNALRAVDSADESDRVTIMEDAKQLMAKTYESANPFEKVTDDVYGTILLFEYMTGIRPRPDQISKMQFVANAISNNDSNAGILMQQIMGSGKTKVMIPFLVFLLFNKGNQLPSILSHISQLPAVQMELPAILQGVGIRTSTVNLDFSDYGDPHAIKKFRESLENMLASKNCIPMLSSHTLLAMRTAFRSLSGRKCIEKEMSKNLHQLYTEFNALFSFLEKNVVAILDEVHISMNPKESFIVQSSSKTAESEARMTQFDVSFMVDFIYGLPDDIGNAIRNNEQDQKSAELIREKLHEYVKDKYAENFGIPDDKVDCFVKFVCGELDGNDSSLSHIEQDWLEAFLMEYYMIEPQSKHEISLLRKLCTTLAVQCLSKTYGEHFGYNDQGRIVAYRDQLPTESYFQRPDESLFYYIVSTIRKGFPDDALIKWIVNTAKMAIKQGSEEIPFEETEAATLFRTLFSDGEHTLTLSSMFGDSSAIVNESGSGTIVVDPGKLLEVKEFLKNSPSAKKELTVAMAREQSRYFPLSYTTTPMDIANVFNGTISMTGTPSNRDAYLAEMTKNTSFDPGSIGQVANKLHTNFLSGRTKIVTVGDENVPNPQNIRNVLNQWKDKADSEKIKNLRLLIDYGGQFKDRPIRELIIDIADFINENINGVEFIEYFDPQLEKFAIVGVDDVVKNRLNFKPKKITSPADRPKNSKSVFTYLDAPRSTGTDPFVSARAHSLLIVNAFQCDLDGFSQAAMRARQLLKEDGQTMDCVLFKEAADSIFKSNSVTMENLLTLLVRNTSRNITMQQVQATSFVLQELMRRFVEKKLRDSVPKDESEGSWNKFEKIRATTADFMLSVDKFDLEQWRQIRTWKKIKVVLTAQMNAMLSKLENVFSTKELENLKNECVTYIDRVNDKIQMLASGDNSYLPEIESDREIQEAGEQERENEEENQQLHENVNMQENMQLNQEEIQRLETMRNEFKNPSGNNPRPRKETPLSFGPIGTHAYNTSKCWKLNEVFDTILKENRLPPKVAAIPENAKVYNSMKVLFLSGRKSGIGKRFYATSNFICTTAEKHSIFSPLRKRVEFLLIYADPKNSGERRCCFVTKEEAFAIEQNIKKGNLVNCLLCTKDGISIADSIDDSRATATSKESQSTSFRTKHADFVAQACWMAHFFNAEIDWIVSHMKFTETMLVAFGMPEPSNNQQDIADRNDFYRNVRRALFFMSDDPKITLQSRIGNLINHYSKFLAKNGLTEDSFREDIFKAVILNVAQEDKEVRMAILTVLCAKYPADITFPNELMKILDDENINREGCIKSYNPDNLSSPQDYVSRYKNLQALHFINAISDDQWLFRFGNKSQDTISINIQSSRDTFNFQSIELPYEQMSKQSLELLANKFTHLEALTLNGDNDPEIVKLRADTLEATKDLGVDDIDENQMFASFTEDEEEDSETDMYSLFTGRGDDSDGDSEVIYKKNDRRGNANSSETPEDTTKPLFPRLRYLKLHNFQNLNEIVVPNVNNLTIELENCKSLNRVVLSSRPGDVISLNDRCKQIFVNDGKITIDELPEFNDSELVESNVTNENEIISSSEPIESSSAKRNEVDRKDVAATSDANAEEDASAKEIGAMVKKISELAGVQGVINLDSDSLGVERTLDPTEKCNSIFQNLGLSLSGIPNDKLESIPENINFLGTTNGKGTSTYISDLYPFAIDSHIDHAVPAKDFATTILRNPNETDFDSVNDKVLYCFRMSTNEGRSLYSTHGISSNGPESCGHKTSKCGFPCDPDKSNTSRGENQYDISDITGLGKFFVSSSPVRVAFNAKTSLVYSTGMSRIKVAENSEPFFKALEKGNVCTIVDLRDTNIDHEYINHDYDSERYDIKYLKKIGREHLSSNHNHRITAYSYKGHIFFHLRVTDLPDNKMPNENDLVTLMNEMDMIEKILTANGIDGSKALFHCHGGLGRSPSLLVARLLWKAMKAAIVNDIGVAWDKDHQNDKIVDGKLNLAAVLKNIFIEGYWSRSTFCQSDDQITGLVAFAEYIANAYADNNDGNAVDGADFLRSYMKTPLNADAGYDFGDIVFIKTDDSADATDPNSTLHDSQPTQDSNLAVTSEDFLPQNPLPSDLSPQSSSAAPINTGTILTHVGIDAPNTGDILSTQWGNLRATDVPNDGNCFFSSIGLAVGDDQDTVRTKLAVPNGWGGSDHLGKVALTYGRPVYVIQSLNGDDGWHFAIANAHSASGEVVSEGFEKFEDNAIILYFHSRDSESEGALSRHWQLLSPVNANTANG
ncbi:MAG: DUF3638 domain-containing protein [Puniceicoccales bacterium]|jgi:hypothetical protein|nr:DUF3638 domain-containing protein [Puniceicoccales bacterium]